MKNVAINRIMWLHVELPDMCAFENKNKPMAGLDRARACGHFASIFKDVAKELHMLARIAI